MLALQVKPKKHILSALIFCLSTLLVGSTSSASADQWMPPKNESLDNAGLNIVESFFNTGESVSRLDVSDRSFTDADNWVRLCKQMGESPCDDTVKSAMYTAYEVLPPCSREIQEWCIEGLSIYPGSNISIIDQAKFIRNTNGPTIKRDPISGLPQGGTISLWKAEGQTNSGGAQTYAVYAYIVGNAPVGGKFTFNNFRAMVLPYSEKTGQYYSDGSVSEFKTASGQTRIGINGASQECAWTEKGMCGLMQDFPSGARAKLSVRIGNSLSGWLMGRMTNPNLEVKTISPAQNLLTVDSEPAEVPKFYVSIPSSKITPEIAAIDPALRDGRPGVHNQLANGTQFEIAAAWATFTDGKAAALYTTWSISTTTTGVGSNCLSDNSRLLGVVSTNSMLYEGKAPSFVDGSLNYKVFGMHYNPDGSVFKGKYDLLVRSETARCLYGFSNAPISASVSVTSSNGEIQATTNVLTEKSGWLHLGAYGFTFSSPTIKVKLLQGGQASNDSSTSNTPVAETSNNELTPQAVIAPKVAKKITITCVKGKITKKVSSINPKCPSGYKKK
jgi:hypothetical protein